MPQPVLVSPTSPCSPVSPDALPGAWSCWQGLTCRNSRLPTPGKELDATEHGRCLPASSAPPPQSPGSNHNEASGDDIGPVSSSPWSSPPHEPPPPERGEAPDCRDGSCPNAVCPHSRYCQAPLPPRRTDALPSGSGSYPCRSHSEGCALH